MSGRRSQQPSISLFSFQDIVTSVTAILILVVLILSLELITRKYVQAASDTAATTSTVVESVAELESLVSRLQAAQAQDDLTSLLTALPSASERDVRILRDQRERIVDQVADARRIRDEARRLAADAVRELQRQESLAGEMLEQEREADDITAEAHKISAANAEERERLDAKQKELKTRPRGETELVYHRPRDTSRQSWLLEVSDAGFVALRLGSGRPEPLGEGDAPGEKFTAWATRLTPANDYVLVLIRPSGIAAVASALERLQGLRIPHGTDYIGEAQEVHDGSAGSDDAGSEAGASE
jgi:hypothetical protein